MDKRSLEFQDFALDKIKVPSSGEVEIDYYEKSGTKDKVTVRRETAPHPDLTNALLALAPHAAVIMGLQAGWDFARENVRDNEDLLRQAMQGAKEADAAFRVTGIRLAGDGQNESVKILGSLKCKNGATGISTPLIRFKGTAMAIEQTIEALCRKVAEEAYLYVFKGKAQQQEMEFEDGSDAAEKPKGKGKGKGKGAGKNQTDLYLESQKTAQDKKDAEWDAAGQAANDFKLKGSDPDAEENANQE